jgi:hypothetical protein
MFTIQLNQTQVRKVGSAPALLKDEGEGMKDEKERLRSEMREIKNIAESQA